MDNASDLLFAFRQYLQAHGRSPATVDLYTDQVGCFLKSLCARDIRQVTKSHIEAYIASLYDHRTIEGKPYSTGTLCVKVRAVKRLFEYLESANIIFINPAEAIREPQKEKSLPRNVLAAKEMEKLLDQPNLALMAGIRDRAILELFYATGIRLEELCRLTVFDADLQGGLVRVNCGKGQKDRVVPMGRHAVKSLREYIVKARPRLTKNNRKARELFINRYGGPISSQVVGIMIRTYAKKAGLKRKVSAHTFRHTFATSLVKNGADITAVQKMLGHADLKTTEQYIRMLGLSIKAVHQKTHPRERDKAAAETVRPHNERIKGHYEGKSL
jgi:site-specific recombinase XerD